MRDSHFVLSKCLAVLPSDEGDGTVAQEEDWDREDNIDNNEDDDDDSAIVISGEANVVHPESSLFIDTQQHNRQRESKEKPGVHQDQFVAGPGR